MATTTDLKAQMQQAPAAQQKPKTIDDYLKQMAPAMAQALPSTWMLTV